MIPWAVSEDRALCSAGSESTQCHRLQLPIPIAICPANGIYLEAFSLVWELTIRSGKAATSLSEKRLLGKIIEGEALKWIDNLYG